MLIAFDSINFLSCFVPKKMIRNAKIYMQEHLSQYNLNSQKSAEQTVIHTYDRILRGH